LFSQLKMWRIIFVIFVFFSFPNPPSYLLLI
jgi:hypothetical protein